MASGPSINRRHREVWVVAGVTKLTTALMELCAGPMDRTKPPPQAQPPQQRTSWGGRRPRRRGLLPQRLPTRQCLGWGAVPACRARRVQEKKQRKGVGSKTRGAPLGAVVLRARARKCMCTWSFVLWGGMQAGSGGVLEAGARRPPHAAHRRQTHRRALGGGGRGQDEWDRPPTKPRGVRGRPYAGPNAVKKSRGAQVCCGRALCVVSWSQQARGASDGVRRCGTAASGANQVKAAGCGHATGAVQARQARWPCRRWHGRAGTTGARRERPPPPAAHGAEMARLGATMIRAAGLDALAAVLAGMPPV